MKRRNFLLASSAASVLTVFAIKPNNNGAAYSNYFKLLNMELKKQGPHKPVMLIDLDRVDQNIDKLKAIISPGVNYRIVAKSLPSPKLLDYTMRASKTNKLMLFHIPFVQNIAIDFPQSDILLGKPMPVGAALEFYTQHPSDSQFKPEQQLQWLIDTPERLIQYQQMAQHLDIKIRVNFEIDIGLHRGGLTSIEQLGHALDIILADLEHLQFSGLMGYDPHVVKVPVILKSSEQAFQESQAIYQSYLIYIQQNYPQINSEELCLNGAGSPTLALHKSNSVINDISAGSCLVKPKDFDIDSLNDFVPAAYIATPVLKKMDGVNIPTVEKLSDLFEWWDPNQQQTFFIYGGLWMADYESPAGLQRNTLYGKSTNQDIVNASKHVVLEVDDHIFLRPTQSESVFLQFGKILAIRNSKIVAHWPILSDK